MDDRCIRFSMVKGDLFFTIATVLWPTVLVAWSCPSFSQVREGYLSKYFSSKLLRMYALVICIPKNNLLTMIIYKLR